MFIITIVLFGFVYGVLLSLIVTVLVRLNKFLDPTSQSLTSLLGHATKNLVNERFPLDHFSPTSIGNANRMMSSVSSSVPFGEYTTAYSSPSFGT